MHVQIEYNVAYKPSLDKSVLRMAAHGCPVDILDAMEHGKIAMCSSKNE